MIPMRTTPSERVIIKLLNVKEVDETYVCYYKGKFSVGHASKSKTRSGCKYRMFIRLRNSFYSPW